MTRKIVVTSALPYANGPIHIGHLVEYLQTDIWVRFQKINGNMCYYFCADDTHGTPVMISARDRAITPEQLIEEVHAEHISDFADFLVEFDNYYSTHSQENREFSKLIFSRLNEAGSITKKDIEQAYCENCQMFLPDRYIRGICPVCKAPDQYGDSCEVCSSTYQPTDLLEPKCSVCSNPPVRKKSLHYFFKQSDYEKQLRELIAKGYTQQSVANKLDEWFNTGLKDWDISRDGPYFGFKIPGEENKFFYVWLDAPIGYMASAKNFCDKNGIDFDELWNDPDTELYHFIGKDIMYFHALFWPAMLMGSGFKTANKLFVHGFLTVNGQKMSKSRGTFIKASTYLHHLDPEFLRYYYAGKLNGSVEDIDLSITDFINRTNSELVGKFANLASRSGPMLTKKLDSTLGRIDEKGKELLMELTSAKQQIIEDFESLNYASLVRKISSLADIANRYVEENQPWVTIKTDPDVTRNTLTVVLNCVRILAIYLKPILPKFAEKIEKFLNVAPLSYNDLDDFLEDHKINKFERLFDRIDKEQVDKMIEESTESQQNNQHESETLSQQSDQAQKDSETQNKAKTELDMDPIAPECTIEDFIKVDLRIAKVIDATPVEGADKLLSLKLDLGGIEKNVFAGIAQAYKPEQLVGRRVVCVANLKPRKMRFGTSEGMILASGSGGSDIFMLNVDDGARPGQRVK